MPDLITASVAVPAVVSEWLDLLRNIPGALKACAKLIGSTASAATAWIDIVQANGENRARNVREEAESRHTFREALVNAGINKLNQRDDLSTRALDHFADQILKGQKNREAVMAETMQNLALEPPEEMAGEPSDDWLDAFSSYAAQANSEMMRKHWGAILAGEIRKPGTVSLATIKMMSIIDQSTAATVQKYMPFCFGSADAYMLPTNGRFSKEPYAAEIFDLHNIGFVTIGAITIENKRFFVGPYSLSRPDGRPIKAHGAALTKPGYQIAMMIGRVAALQDAKVVRGALAEQGNALIEIRHRETGDLLSSGDDVSPDESNLPTRR